MPQIGGLRFVNILISPLRSVRFNKIIIVNIRANGRRGGGEEGRGDGERGGGSAGGALSIRARATHYLSSHRSPSSHLTKKEIGFADFDPFVFGQRPAMRAGAEKCEGALIGRGGPAQPPRRSLPRRAVQGRTLPRRDEMLTLYLTLFSQPERPLTREYLCTLRVWVALYL